MPSFPLGIVNARGAAIPTLAPEAQNLLDSGKILGFSRTCHLYGNAHHAPDWGSAVSVCVPTSDTSARWVCRWEDLRALRIPGLGNAIVSITQGAHLSPFTLQSLWKRQPRSLADGVDLAFISTATGHWIGLDEPSHSLVQPCIELKAALDPQGPGLEAYAARATFPGADIGTFILQQDVGGSAHNALEALAVMGRALPTFVRILGAHNTDDSWLGSVPWAVASRDTLLSKPA